MSANQHYIDYARQQALANEIDPDIFLKQINQESGFNPNAVSPAGAIGIAQFMPGTAAGLGVDPWDPVASLEAAARLMKSYLDRFGSYELALAAYNAGPGAVEQYGGIPPYPETQAYISRILGGISPSIPRGITATAETGHAGGLLLLAIAALVIFALVEVE